MGKDRLSSFSGWLGPLLCFSSLLLLVTIIRPDWLFTNPYELPWFDPFVYLGYFLHYPSYVSANPGYYPGERIAVILPGYLLYSLFGAARGEAALRLVLWSVGVGSFYYTMVHIVGRRSALIAALLLGAQATYLTAASWDYIDGFANSYLLLTLALITFAREKQTSLPFLWQPRVWLAGASGALLLLTSSFTVVFFPCLLLFALWKFRPESWLRAVSLVGAACSGGIVMLLLLATINVFNGGPFFLFWSQVQAVLLILSGKETSANPSAWQHILYHAPWAALPAVCFLLAIPVLFRSGMIRSFLLALSKPFIGPRRMLLKAPSARELLALLALYQFAVFITFQATSYTVLSFFFYASLLVPFALLFVGALISDWIARLSSREYYIAVLSLIVLQGVLLIPKVGLTILNVLQVGYYATPTWLAIVIGLAGILPFLFTRCPKFVAALALSVLCVANVPALNSPQLNYFNHNRRGLGFRLITHAVNYFQEQNTDGQLGIWMNLQEPFGGNFFWAIWIATHIRMGPFRSTELPKFDSAAVRPGGKVMVVSGDEHIEVKILPTLAEKGFRGSVQERRLIQEGAAQFWMTLIRIDTSVSEVH